MLTTLTLSAVLALTSCARAGLEGQSFRPPWPIADEFRLDVRWLTPHVAALVWQCDASPPRFDHYELCTRQKTTTRCTTPADDPGLALIDCNSAQGLWHPTTVAGLRPQTGYSAWLEIVETNGDRRASRVLSLETPAPASTRVELFDETLPLNITLQFLELSKKQAASGTVALKRKEEPSAKVEVIGLGRTLLDLTEERFAKGYLEVFVQYDAPGSLAFRLDSDTVVSGYGPPVGYLAVSAGSGFQRIQVPLASFYAVKQQLGFDEPLRAAQLTNVQNISFASPSWKDSSQVYFDNISINY
jgi:hypothetical protein